MALRDGEGPMSKKKIGGVTYAVNDVVVFDSPQGWRRGTVVRFGSGHVWIRVEGTTVQQKIADRNVRPKEAT